jgi:hypothetical protein
VLSLHEAVSAKKIRITRTALWNSCFYSSFGISHVVFRPRPTRVAFVNLFLLHGFAGKKLGLQQIKFSTASSILWNFRLALPPTKPGFFLMPLTKGLPELNPA